MPTYQRFTDPAAAQELADLLRGEGLDATVAANAPLADTLFTGSVPEDHHVILPVEQFPIADGIVQRDAAATAAQADPDHYLFKFTDKELYDLLLRPDEWSAFDHELAKRVLAERGSVVPDDLLKSLREQRMGDLRGPEPNQTPFIVIGYFMAVLGGAMGFAIA